jgi:AsmA protein
VFSQEGLKLDGFISADVSLNGSQEDAVNGRYERLQNSGVLTLRNIRTYSKYFPHPFLIKNGILPVQTRKDQFRKFRCRLCAIRLYVERVFPERHWLYFL